MCGIRERWHDWFAENNVVMIVIVVLVIIVSGGYIPLSGVFVHTRLCICMRSVMNLRMLAPEYQTSYPVYITLP
jgi:hypothetical protein